MKKIPAEQFLKAAYNGNISIVEQYIQEGSDINTQDRYGWTALMEEIRCNRKEIVKLLLNENADVNIKTVTYGTALILAKKRGYIEIAEMIEKYDFYRLRNKLNNNTTMTNSII
jgi:ankyrin repeat protein